MFSLLTMLEARIAYSHKSRYIYIHNKLNIMSYNSACIKLLRSLLFTLYIHSLCVSRRAELARGQRRCAVLYVSGYCGFLFIVHNDTSISTTYNMS